MKRFRHELQTQSPNALLVSFGISLRLRRVFFPRLWTPRATVSILDICTTVFTYFFTLLFRSFCNPYDSACRTRCIRRDTYITSVAVDPCLAINASFVLCRRTEFKNPWHARQSFAGRQINNRRISSVPACAVSSCFVSGIDASLSQFGKK